MVYKINSLINFMRKMTKIVLKKNTEKRSEIGNVVPSFLKLCSEVDYT